MRDTISLFTHAFPLTKWVKKIKATRSHSARLIKYVSTREAYLWAQLRKYKLTESRLKPELIALREQVNDNLLLYFRHYLKGCPKNPKHVEKYNQKMQFHDFVIFNNRLKAVNIRFDFSDPFILIGVYPKLKELDSDLKRFIDSIKSEFHHTLPASKEESAQAFEEFRMKPDYDDPKAKAAVFLRKADVKALKKAARKRKGGGKKRGESPNDAASPAKDTTHIDNKRKARKSRVKATKNKGLRAALSQHEHNQGFMKNAKGILTALRQSNTLDELRENLVSAGSGTNLHQVEDVWSTKVNNQYRITFRTRTDESGFLRVYDIRLTAHYEGLSNIKT